MGLVLGIILFALLIEFIFCLSTPTKNKSDPDARGSMGDVQTCPIGNMYHDYKKHEDT